jgi:hypothetical protein
VSVEYGRSTTAADHRDADLVVVADGSSSRNRSALADAVRPTVVERPNRFVWLGTDRPLAEMNFFFREHAAGLFVAHAYPHEAGQGTWIVETDAETFAAAGLASASEAETRALMEEVFTADLNGHSLITRDSFWRQFPLINCERWTVGNVALLGDAKATVHYSIGSGTKIAMEDAAVLVQAVTASTSVEAGLAKYEAIRRPEVGELQRNAFGSMQWFESLGARWPMDPAQFALSGLTRKTDETYRAIAERAPDIARAALRAFCGPGSAPDVSPLDAPITLSGLAFSGRRAAYDRMMLMDLPRDAADVSPAIEEGLRRDARSGMNLLLLEVDPGVLAAHPDDRLVSQALSAFEAISRLWPESGRVGLRIHPTREPADALPLLARFVALGCGLIAVAPAGPGVAHQCVVSDLVRHGLGVGTICEGLASVDEAETALVAGRADLVAIG